MFGQNPNLPGIMTDEVPALDGKTSSDIFCKALKCVTYCKAKLCSVGGRRKN